MQVVPCAVLALFIHPSTSHHLLNRIFWAFCVYLEAVSVLPQLRVMQNTKVHLFEFKLFYEPFFFVFVLFHMNRYTAFLYNLLIPVLSDCWTIHCSLCICFGRGKVPELCSLGSPGLILQSWFYMFYNLFVAFWNWVCSICCFTFGLMQFWDSQCSYLSFGRGILIIQVQNAEHGFQIVIIMICNCFYFIIAMWWRIW